MGLLWIAIGCGVYLAIGARLTREIARRRPELFRLGDGFFLHLAAAMVICWPLCVFGILLGLIVRPAESAWEERTKR